LQIEVCEPLVYVKNVHMVKPGKGEIVLKVQAI